MQEPSYSTDTIYRVWNEKEGVCLEIRPWPEDPVGVIELRTPDSKSAEWFGKQSLTMPKAFAAEIATALAKAAA